MHYPVIKLGDKKIQCALIIISTSLLFSLVYINSTNIEFSNLSDDVPLEINDLISNETYEKLFFHTEIQCTDLNYINKTVDGTDSLDTYVKVCEKSDKHEDNKSAPNLCEYCPFKEPNFLKERKPFVALASFGGSGNSWTRELLESLTGIYTGSVYDDVFGEFPGSKQCPLRGKVYIVKTHAKTSQTYHSECSKQDSTIQYQKAMYILRNPYESIMSAFNLDMTSNKVGFANQSDFQSEAWRKYVKERSKGWRIMTTYWLTTFNKPVYTIVYENLTKNTLRELNDIGRFLRLQPTYIHLYCAKHCLKVKYHRVRKPYWMNKETVFDKLLKEVVNSEIKALVNKIKNMDNIVKHLNGYVL
ncbi:hypothetical protein ACF0H5_003187 [Mactra antiquata]